MPLFYNIRSRFGKRKINKTIKKSTRKTKAINYQQARSVGIVYEIRNKDYQEFIKEFVHYLSQEIGFKTIKTIGYYKSKKAPDFLPSGIKYEYINHQKLGLFLLPKTTGAIEFINTPFDILIDLSENYEVPLKHLVAQNNAKFKVGRFCEDTEFLYDFMITLPPKSSVKELITQINHYLTRLNRA